MLKADTVVSLCYTHKNIDFLMLFLRLHADKCALLSRLGYSLAARTIRFLALFISSDKTIKHFMEITGQKCFLSPTKSTDENPSFLECKMATTKESRGKCKSRCSKRTFHEDRHVRPNRTVLRTVKEVQHPAACVTLSEVHWSGITSQSNTHTCDDDGMWEEVNKKF